MSIFFYFSARRRAAATSSVESPTAKSKAQSARGPLRWRRRLASPAPTSRGRSRLPGTPLCRRYSRGCGSVFEKRREEGAVGGGEGIKGGGGYGRVSTGRNIKRIGYFSLCLLFPDILFAFVSTPWGFLRVCAENHSSKRLSH